MTLVLVIPFGLILGVGAAYVRARLAQAAMVGHARHPIPSPSRPSSASVAADPTAVPVLTKQGIA